jgi:hypothetical protein
MRAALRGPALSAPDDDDAGFLSRWARRKTAARTGASPVPEPVPVPTPQPRLAPSAQTAVDQAAPGVPHEAAAEAGEPASSRPPPPTWDDVAGLTPDADFSRFVGHEVDPGVRNAAMKTLFADPHYNLMDGLDTYIDDYGKPDPIPPDMLRGLVQSRMLGLFDDETSDDKPVAVTAALPAEPHPHHDEDPAVQLQPDDAAGSPVGEPGCEDAGGDPAGQR